MKLATIIKKRVYPVDVRDSAQAMDFFHGLNDVKYAVFKINMLNGWAARSIIPPSMPNEVYQLAGSWIRQPTHVKGGGCTATNMIIEEDAKKTRKRSQKRQGAASKEEEKPRIYCIYVFDAKNVGTI
jgi:hypothetical protein